MKKLITICTVVGLMVLTTSMVYALPSDNFDDNSMNTSMWGLFETDSSNAWLDETNQRLEMRSNENADENVENIAVYYANGWGLSTAADFSLRVDFHNSFASEANNVHAGVMLGIGKGTDVATIANNNATIEACWGWNNSFEPCAPPPLCGSAYGYHYSYEGGTGWDANDNRSSSDGTLYVSYDASKDELYLSHTGYGKDNAYYTIPGLLKGTWSCDVVTPFIGGTAENVAIASGDAYLDNFVVDSGTYIPEPAQNLFVSGGGGSGYIYEFTPGGVKSTFASDLNHPHTLAFNIAGDLFEADGNSNNIYEFTPGGVKSTFASDLNAPHGLAFNSAGELFETDGQSGNIYEFTPSGVKSTFASGLNTPRGLAFNSGGNLFEADSGSGNIYEFTPDGVRSTFASELNAPFGLAFNSAGDLFEADANSGNIYEFTPDGVRSTFTSGLNSPRELAFNSAGVLFVTDHVSGNIYEFTPDGMQSTFASGLDHPWGLAFQPITGDLNGDGKVNFEDFAIMASHWLNTNCADNNNCNGTDLDFSGTVDWKDLRIFCQHWLEGVTQ
jgi:hypothetical protein